MINFHKTQGLVETRLGPLSVNLHFQFFAYFQFHVNTMCEHLLCRGISSNTDNICTSWVLGEFPTVGPLSQGF